MLATIFSRGAAAISAASMRWLPVAKAPSLSASLAASSAGFQRMSSGLSSTSKCWRSRSTMSGKIARATRMRGLLLMARNLLSKEPDESHGNEQRNQNAARPKHVSQKPVQFRRASAGDVEKFQIGGRVVQNRVEQARGPELHGRTGLAIGARDGRDDGAKRAVDAGPEHRDHRDEGQEDAREQLGHLLHRRPAEAVVRMHLRGGDAQRQQRH